MDKDDDIINLRGGDDDDDDEPEFVINRADGSTGGFAGGAIGGSVEAAPNSQDKVKVKFDKFVNLIATHAYEEVFEKHVDEDVIISTDLLADLANAQEEKQDRKVPLVFVFGILIGVVVAWLLLR